jgi:protein disulfide-isomerase
MNRRIPARWDAFYKEAIVFCRGSFVMGMRWIRICAWSAVVTVIAARAQAAAPNDLLWQSSLEDAKRIAGQTNRLVLVHFWSPSCVPCKQLEKNVFSQPQVQQTITARFVPVKVNADDYPTTAKYYGITHLPSDLIITPGGQIVGRMVSPLKPDVYLQQLAIAASGTGPSADPNAAAYAAYPAVSAYAPAAAPVAAYAPPMPAAAPPAMPAAQAPAANVGWGSAAQQLNNAPTTVPAYSDNRYADYRQRYGAAQNVGYTGATQPPAMPAAQQQIPAGSWTPPAYAPAAAQSPYLPPSNAAPSYVPPYSPPASPPAVNPTPGNPYLGNGPALGPAGASAYAAPPAAAQSAAAPLAIDGYSPVTLVDQQRWQVGDRRWGAVHRGRTYLFSSQEEQQRFLANPDHYSPAISGQDVVLALDYNQNVEGKRGLGVQYQGRMYFFSSESSRQVFAQNPQRYAGEVLQAENAGRTTIR